MIACISNPFVTSSHPALQNRKVQSLMLLNNTQWDPEVVLDLFNDRDANLIFSVPLNTSRTCDIWFWRWEKLGFFFVKCTYCHIQEQFEADHHQETDFLWKKLWKLQICSKDKHFLWRAVSNCLPTRFQLFLKGVHLNTSCHFCGISEETILH